MAEEKVKKEDKEEQKQTKDYDETDVKRILAQVSFHFWGEVVDWLKKHGTEGNELTKEQVDAMISDFQRLSKEGVEFTSDSAEAERVAKEHR